MKPKLLSMFALLGSGILSNVYADTASEIAELKERLAKLESQQSESSGLNLSDKVSFGGLVEVEGFYSDNFDNKSESDITVATVELGLEVEIADNVTATVATLYEEDDTDLEIDVATLVFSDLGNFEILLGQDYLPFGSFETHLVNDTLVLELAETRETTAMASVEAGLLSASAYVFNGDVDDGNGVVENYGLSLGLGSDEFSVSIDYISNVADSDGISGEFDPAGVDFDDLPDAIDVHAMAALGPVTLLAEYFQSDEIEWAGDVEPEAWHVEVGVVTGDWTFAAAYQETEDAIDDDGSVLPEQRFSLGAGVELTENLAVSVEYWHDEDYDLDDGGTDEEADSIVAQVAVSF